MVAGVEFEPTTLLWDEALRWTQGRVSRLFARLNQTMNQNPTSQGSGATT
jgi:hypothetical protein